LSLPAIDTFLSFNDAQLPGPFRSAALHIVINMQLALKHLHRRTQTRGGEVNTKLTRHPRPRRHKAPLPGNFEQTFFKQEPSQRRPREQSPGSSGASSGKEREQQQRLIVHGTRPSIPTASRQIATSSASDQRRSAAPPGGQQSFSDGSSSVVGGGYNLEGSERAGAGVGGMIEASTLRWGGAAEHGIAPLFRGSDGSRLRDQRGGFDAPAYPLSPQVSPPNPTLPKGGEANSMKNAVIHEGHRRRPAPPAKRRPPTGTMEATPDPPSPELLDNRIARNYNVTSSPPMQGGAPSSWGSSVTPSSAGGTMHGTASPGTCSEIEKCVEVRTFRVPLVPWSICEMCLWRSKLGGQGPFCHTCRSAMLPSRRRQQLCGIACQCQVSSCRHPGHHSYSCGLVNERPSAGP
jgi:hypothetical protein